MALSGCVLAVATAWLSSVVSGAAETIIIPATSSEVAGGLSPLNWIRTTDGIHSMVCGASFKLKFKDTGAVGLKVDTARHRYSAGSRYPILSWSVNGGPEQTHQLVEGESEIPLSTGVKEPVIDFHIKGFSPFEDRFTGDVPTNAVSITGFSVEGSGKVIAPAPEPVWLNIGDSILSGDGAAYQKDQGRPPDDRWAAAGEARASYGYLLARHFGHRESRLAFGGNSWTGGLAKIPPVTDLVDRITSTKSRLTKDKLVPVPQVVLINLGENRVPAGETIVAALEKLRERCTADTRIIVMIPVSGKGRAEISAAVNAYQKAENDKRVHLVDAGAITFDTADGQHPTAPGHRSIYQAVLPEFEKILKP